MNTAAKGRSAVGSWRTCGLTLGLLLACDGSDPDDGARALLEQVEAADYRSWARAPGFEELVESAAPHGNFTEVFINEVLVEALAADPGSLDEWPVGSILVKDGWDDEAATERTILAIMEKRELGWYFEEYTEFGADAEPAFAGLDPEPGICTGCHSAGADMVWAFGLP